MLRRGRKVHRRNFVPLDLLPLTDSLGTENRKKFADVAELADAHGLGPCGETRGGSTPSIRTNDGGFPPMLNFKHALAGNRRERSLRRRRGDSLLSHHKPRTKIFPKFLFGFMVNQQPFPMMRSRGISSFTIYNILI